MIAILAAAGYLALSLSQAEELPPSPETPATSAVASRLAAIENSTAGREARTQIVLRYKTDADKASVKGAADAAGATEKRELPAMRIKVLKVPESARARIIERLKSNPRIEFVEADAAGTANATFPNDPLYWSQHNLSTSLMDIAWDRTKGTTMTVGVVDSGINANHPELAGKVVAGGKDFINNDNDPADDNNHGSWVSSVIAANTNNGTGVAGGCWNCKILPVKAFAADNSGTSSSVAQGIQYAADQGAKIINVSFSLSVQGANSTLDTAVNYATNKGAIVVATSGNTGKNESYSPGNNPNAIAVAATGANDSLASYSTYGSHVDIAAYGTTTGANGKDNLYTQGINGTSLSAPTVAAALALVWSAYPNATAAQIRQAVLSTTDTCCSGNISGGRLNVARALAYMAGNGTVADTVKPTLNVTSPAQNATVSGTMNIAGTASDNTAFSKVQLQENGVEAFGDVRSNFTITKNTAGIANGTVLNEKLTAYDSSGNASTPVTRTVTVNNGGTTPTPPTPNPSGKTGDINNDSKVNITDLSLLLANWNKTTATGDLNNDGKVNITDLSLLLANWNK